MKSWVWTKHLADIRRLLFLFLKLHNRSVFAESSKLRHQYLFIDILLRNGIISYYSWTEKHKTSFNYGITDGHDRALCSFLFYQISTYLVFCSSFCTKTYIISGNYESHFFLISINNKCMSVQLEITHVPIFVSI